MKESLLYIAVITFGFSALHFHAALRGKYVGRLRIAGLRDRNLGFATTRHRIGSAAFGLIGLAVAFALFYLGRR
jgi:hypothetical protein